MMSRKQTIVGRVFEYFIILLYQNLLYKPLVLEQSLDIYIAIDSRRNVFFE